MKNYEIRIFSTNRFTSHIPSMLTRVRNQLATAVEKYTLMPKMILIILDEDLIQYLRAKEVLSNYSMEKTLSWLMRQLTRIVDSYKESWPRKSVKDSFPQFIWIASPYNVHFPNNENRARFNSALEYSAKSYEYHNVFRLKKVWDEEDRTLYLKDQRRFTNVGLKTYWEAIDRTAKFCDTTIMKRFSKIDFKNSGLAQGAFNFSKEKNKSSFRKNNKKSDRYHYYNDKKGDDEDHDQGVRLPKPRS